MTKPLEMDGFNGELEDSDSSSYIAESIGEAILGATEPVMLAGEEFLARVDSGAEKSSICESLVERFNLGPAVEETRVRSSNGSESRDVLLIPVKLRDKDIMDKFTVSDRRTMDYPILIGRNILERGFLVDVTQ